jgi:pantoate--beta-alanine ligase
MRISNTIADVRNLVRDVRRSGATVSFVSTMGGLHAGHTSLVTHAKTLSDYVIAGIFLNPTHFAAHEDYDTYPRTFDADIRQLEAVGCDAVFAPSVQELYPNGTEVQATVTVPIVSDLHCGASRPHFFSAVATIVTKLLNIIQPDVAMLGEKDYQQLVVCQRMVDTLNIPTQVVGSPIVREPSGLAMSSRNEYLKPESRAQAAQIYRSLQATERAFLAGERDFQKLGDAIRTDLKGAGLEPDYVNFADPEVLGPAPAGSEDVVLLVAAYIDGVRLIDNIRLTAPSRAQTPGSGA